MAKVVNKETRTEEVKKAMRHNGILDKQDAENAVEFVRSLMEIEKEYTEANESYATNSIAEMKTAIERIGYLDLNELLEGVD